MLIRLLLLIVAIAIAYLFWRRLRAQHRPAERQFVPMVRCAHCGLHLPSSEAVAADGRLYCCQEHARLSGTA